MNIMIKTIAYLIVAAIVMWALDGVPLNEIFKQNRNVQARIMYLLITLSVTYLVTNFLFDFLKL